MFVWNSLAFLMIQQMLAIWSLVPLPFLKPAWTSGSSRFMYCCIPPKKENLVKFSKNYTSLWYLKQNSPSPPSSQLSKMVASLVVQWIRILSRLAQSCPTHCNPMDCSLPGSSVHGIFQARYWSGLSFPSPGTRHANKVMLKFIQASVQHYVNWELLDVQAGFRKGRRTREQHSLDHRKSKEISGKKVSTSASLTRLKHLTVWITTNCGKFLKRWEYWNSLPASWETCMRVKKEQL